MLALTLLSTVARVPVTAFHRVVTEKPATVRPASLEAKVGIRVMPTT
ncbi:MAG TPA: hypothetical protein VN284_18005 [Rhizobium sp.]|nr:hypothetical protein [Rhizobium sp.]